MSISVILVTKDRTKQIQACVKALCSLPVAPQQIIVIDSSSNNLSETAVKRLSHKKTTDVIYKRVLDISLAYSRNEGMRLAKNDLIALIGDDCLPDKKWITALLDEHTKHPDIAIIGGAVLPIQTNNYWSNVEQDLLQFSLTSASKEQATHLSTYNLSYKRKPVEAEGIIFDDNMPSLDDVDFVVRAKNSGLKTLYSPEIEIRRTYSTTVMEFITRWFVNGYGVYEFTKKHTLRGRRKKYIQDIFSNNEARYFIHTRNYASLFGSYVAHFSSGSGFLFYYFYWKLYRFLLLHSRRINRQIIELSRTLKLSSSVGFPLDVFIEPTNLCNAKCPLCPTGTGTLKREKGFMSFELYKKIIDQIKWYTENIYLWNLGEPFLNQEIYSMIKYANKFGIFQMSSTNGYVLYTKATTVKMIESGLNRLIIGMDGLDAKTLNTYRVNVDFDKLMKGLYVLRDEKAKRHSQNPKIDFQFILMKHNQHQLEEARALAKELNTDFRIKYVSLEMVDAENKQRFLPDQESHRIYELAKRRFALKRPLVNKPCVAWDGLVINWSGTVNPCIFDYYSKIVLGDVTKEGVIPIWRGKIMKNLRTRILRGRAKIDICIRCPIQERLSEDYLL